MYIMRDELAVPQELAGLGIEGDYRICIEIGARSDFAVKVRCWIANRQIENTGFDVQREWRP
jgi:hypothetical protein